MVKSVGKPDARNGHVRFDERGRETGGCQSAPHRALPRLYAEHAPFGRFLYKHGGGTRQSPQGGRPDLWHTILDRKSTRLNSSHLVISYAVFCLKKKKKKI